MRISIYIICIAIFFSVWCSTSVGSDYFNRITMVSDGRISRFAYMPISVHISDPPVPLELRDAYIGDIEYALDQWMRCSEGQLQFEQVDSEDADIRICWTKEPLSGEADPLGEASLVRFESGDFYVTVSILLHKRPSLSVTGHKELKAVALHELGHAIGLWGHSRDRSDIMYWRSNAITPSRSDKNTLLKLLATSPNAPFHESAIAELRADISRNRDAAHLHFWLGTVYADNRQDDLAIEELLTALKLSPNLMKAANRLGRIFQAEGMYGKAIAYYSREAELEPSPYLYGIIGVLYLRQGQYDKSIEYFEKALDMDRDFSAARADALAAYHRWTSELIKDNQYDEAVSVLGRALKLFPTSRVIHYDMGTAHEAGGKYEKAIEEYKKAMEIEPSFVAAKSNIASCINNMGAEQMQSKNWENSIEFCNQALKWDPGCWEAMKNLESATFGLGQEKYKSGLLDEAIGHYRTVLDMNPDKLDAHNSLGFALYEKGMYKDSLAQFQTSLNIDPTSEDAKLGLGTVKRQMRIDRAKIAVFLTVISMILCVSIISLFRHWRHAKPPIDREYQSE